MRSFCTGECQDKGGMEIVCPEAFSRYRRFLKDEVDRWFQEKKIAPFSLLG